MFLECPICGCAVAEGEIPCCGPRVPLLRPETALAELRQDVRADLVTVGDALTAERRRISELEGAIDDLRQMIRDRDIALLSLSFMVGQVAQAAGMGEEVRALFAAEIQRVGEMLLGSEDLDPIVDNPVDKA
ncbi:MAG: hypothetical protein V3V34_11660 [Kiloniellales bacterium]